MKKLSAKKILIASVVCAPLFFSACGNDIIEEIENPEVDIEKDGVRWTRPEQQLVVSLPNTNENTTRVVLVDGKYTTPAGSGVKATWETTDNVGVWNITAAPSGQTGYNTVHPNSETQHTQFGGTVNCNQGDRIAVFYPYGDGTGITTATDGTITLDLRKQKGTLDDIAKNYDLVYGEATVGSVSNGEASASLGVLTAGVTILELQFKDADNGNALIEMERLQIKVDGGNNRATLNLNNLSAGLTMVTSSEEVVDTFDIRLDSPSSRVYVAMFGTAAGKTFHFSVIDKYGFQHKASAKAPSSITAGQITRATPKAKDGEYIEFDEVKWAKGNLLWDTGNMKTMTDVYLYAIWKSYDCYFIAPSQEWSPEQLKSGLLSNMPCWPYAPPAHQDGVPRYFTVPDPSIYDGYYSTFYLGTAGKNGETSARGRVITPGSPVPSGGSTQTVVQCEFVGDINYTGRLWTEVYCTTPISLADALNDGSPTSYFMGDLPYLVTEGDYGMPTKEHLESIFTHPNAVWGVYVVDKNGQGNDIDMRAGTKGGGSQYYNGNSNKLPIYGLYVDKTRNYEQMLATNSLYTGQEWGNKAAVIPANKKPAYKGCAFLLTEDDLRKGIFLPADGTRVATLATGGLEWSLTSSIMPGEYCSYICGTFGNGSFGTKNARHWTARPNNHGSNGNGGDDGVADVIVTQWNELRTNTGSIRPIYIGDIHK